MLLQTYKVGDKVVKFRARGSQPCKAVAIMHDGCEMVVQNFIPQVNVTIT